MTIHEGNGIDVNANEALQRFLDLAAIPGRSGDEAAVAARIVEILRSIGVPDDQISFDGAETRTRLPGNCGNLIVTLLGGREGPRTLLSAHMDTVPICVGSQPVVEGDRVFSRADTGLGADNRGGCAAILTAIAERLGQGDRHFPPAVIAFFVQEEIGLEGARHLDVDLVGRVDRAFNFDGGTIEKVTVGAIGGERMTIGVSGIPSHAGAAPEQGVSAIVVAARAITDLHNRGWLGKIEKEDGCGTSNVGIIRGGEATNVITPRLDAHAEARSHDAEMRARIVAEIKAAFHLACEEVKNLEGVAGEIDFQSRVDYESFRLSDDHPSIVTAMEAIRLVNRQPFCDVANGGLDANWLFRHGIPAVTLACGQRNIHTADEWLDIDSYQAACRMATWLITDGVDFNA